MRKIYNTPLCEILQVKTEGLMAAMTGQTGKYDGDDVRPIPTGESHDSDGDGEDDEEATAKGWSGGIRLWDD
ncbi:MAG: hypothetical protein K6A82_07390 [Prevotella sp.]|nr:hypothetical protein [Prevotella sp.]